MLEGTGRGGSLSEQSVQQGLRCPCSGEAMRARAVSCSSATQDPTAWPGAPSPSRGKRIMALAPRGSSWQPPLNALLGSDCRGCQPLGKNRSVWTRRNMGKDESVRILHEIQISTSILDRRTGYHRNDNRFIENRLITFPGN